MTECLAGWMNATNRWMVDLTWIELNWVGLAGPVSTWLIESVGERTSEQVSQGGSEGKME